MKEKQIDRYNVCLHYNVNAVDMYNISHGQRFANHRHALLNHTKILLFLTLTTTVTSILPYTSFSTATSLCASMQPPGRLPAPRVGNNQTSLEEIHEGNFAGRSRHRANKLAAH